MLHVPGQPGFLWYLSSVAAGTRPAAAFGTSVVPGQNAYGTYTELIDGALVTEDVWKIRINVNSNSTAAAIRDTLLTVGWDTAAGVSYVDELTHLLVSDAITYSPAGPGVWYEFPFHIPAGSSIAVKASVNNATVGTLRCFVQLWGRPTNPEITKVGKIFRTFGQVTASSRGTVITTPGTTSEGTWEQLGSATVEELWYWEFGFGCGDADMTAQSHHVDIGVGDASNKRVLIEDAIVGQTASEQIGKQLGYGVYNRVAVGDLVYGRLQNSGAGATDTDTSLIAYGVG